MMVIGLTCGLAAESCGQSIALKKYYQEALAGFGVQTVLLPVQAGDAAALVSRIDGLLLTGGGDIHPCFWQEEPLANLKANGPYDLERDYFELALIEAARKVQKPILGICRGMQILNVALGGSLWQDLGEKQDHRGVSHQQPAPENQLWHPVQAADSTMAAFFAETRFYVNSFHHQGIKALAKGLHLGARATDGVIEAVYDFEEGYVIGVQWHPERLVAYHQPSQKLFGAFIEAIKVIRPIATAENNNPTPIPGIGQEKPR